MRKAHTDEAKNMTNRFTAIDKFSLHSKLGSVNDAGRLARAFIASRNSDELAAILRYISRADNSNLFGYLSGCHFTDVDGDNYERWTVETFDSIRDEAYRFLGE